jgi:hypothetical protein
MSWRKKKGSINLATVTRGEMNCYSEEWPNKRVTPFRPNPELAMTA